MRFLILRVFIFPNSKRQNRIKKIKSNFTTCEFELELAIKAPIVKTPKKHNGQFDIKLGLNITFQPFFLAKISYLHLEKYRPKNISGSDNSKEG